MRCAGNAAAAGVGETTQQEERHARFPEHSPQQGPHAPNRAAAKPWLVAGRLLMSPFIPRDWGRLPMMIGNLQLSSALE